MKQLLVILAIIILYGCKTKKVDTTKTKEELRIEKVTQLDSLVRSNLVELEKLKTQSLLEISRFELETITDSSGIILPLEYKHTKYGKVVEQISLKGGKLLSKQNSKKEILGEVKTFQKKEEKHIVKDAKALESTKQKTKTKQTDVRVKGFQPGFYLALSISLVAIAVILFFLWRLGVFKRKDNRI